MILLEGDLSVPWEVIGGFLAGLAALITAIVGVAKVLVEVRAARRDTAEAAAKTVAVAEQLSPNHGSSARDSLDRTEDTVNRIDARTVQNSTELSALRDDVSDIRQQVRRHDAELGRANQLLAQGADRATQAERHMSAQLDDHSERIRSLETITIHKEITK